MILKVKRKVHKTKVRPPPNNFFLNRPLISSPTHFVTSLCNKVKKYSWGIPQMTQFFSPFDFPFNALGPVSWSRLSTTKLKN